jgi:hypothetical protein
VYAILPITKHNRTKKAAQLVDQTGVCVHLFGESLQFGCHLFGVRAAAQIIRWAKEG